MPPNPPTSSHVILLAKDSVSGVPVEILASNSQIKVLSGYKSKRHNILFTGIGAYAQHDVVGALVEIPNWADVAGGSATVRDMRITVNKNDITPQFEVHFFRASNPTVAADNVTWTELDADYEKRGGYVQMPPCAKAGGGGVIDFVRAQHTDAEYGAGMSREITCAAGQTSIWALLKLMNAAGVTFANAPGNTIRLSIVSEPS